MLHALANRNHLVSVDGLEIPEVLGMFDAADRFSVGRHDRVLDGRVVAPMFFQPSTRTRLGFETAALRLGGHVSGFADAGTTRAAAATNESFDDIVRTVSAMADVLVVRCGDPGAGARAAAIATCPVVNAGDREEHPSQALIDAHAMRSFLGMPYADMVVGFSGDLDNRCTKPLVKLLARLGVRRMVFLAEPGRPPAVSVVDQATSMGTAVCMTEDVCDLLACCHVVSAVPRDARFTKDSTRTYSDADTLTPDSHVITAERIRRTNSKAHIMHALPRRNEISTDVDHLPNAAYFRQVALSVFLRMAVFDHVSRPSVCHA